MPAESPRILLVEDDTTVSAVLRRYLEREGFEVDLVDDGARAAAAIEASAPDLVILDLMLPNVNGFDVCRRVRARADVPIIVLSARCEEADRVAALELGADDYVVKPFSPREVAARVNAVLRRARRDSGPLQEHAPPLVAGELEVEPASHSVTVAGRPVRLTVREFELLVFLMRHPGEVFRREELLEHVWGYVFGGTSTVTVHVQRLREKIEPDPAQPRWIRTVWGVGYLFEPKPASAAGARSGSDSLAADSRS